MSHSHEKTKQPKYTRLQQIGAGGAVIVAVAGVPAVVRAVTPESNTARTVATADSAATTPESYVESEAQSIAAAKAAKAGRVHNLHKAAAVAVTNRSVAIAPTHKAVHTASKAATHVANNNLTQSPSQAEASNNAQVAELIAENAQTKATELTHGLNNSIPTNTMLKNVLVLSGTIEKKDASGKLVPFVHNAFYLAGANEHPASETNVEFKDDVKTAWFGYVEHNKDGSMTVERFEFNPATMTYVSDPVLSPVLSTEVFTTQVTLPNRQPGDAPYAYDVKTQQTMQDSAGRQISPGLLQ